MRSAELETALTKFFGLPTFNSSDRIIVSKTMCGVAFEHAESVKMLIASGNFTSALGLVRLQYEALVRGMWLRYAASDDAVAKLTNEFSRESVGNSEKLPMPAKMLESLEGKAPEAAMISLLDFKEHQWKPLSSYVHGGIHAVHRHSKGYPIMLLQQVLKTSNGLSTMVAMLLVILSGDTSQQGKIRAIQIEYFDCLPELKQTN
jgi:hypothetical protein